MATPTITSKGQITLPRQVRDALDLRCGDQLIFVVVDGLAQVYPVHRRGIMSLAGSVTPPDGVTVTHEAERDAAEQEAVEEVLTKAQREG